MASANDRDCLSHCLCLVAIVAVASFLSTSVLAHTTSPAQGGTMSIGTTFPGRISVLHENGETCTVTAQAAEVVVGTPLLAIQSDVTQPALDVTLTVKVIRLPVGGGETRTVQLGWRATGLNTAGLPNPNCSGSGTVTFSVTAEPPTNGICGRDNGASLTGSPIFFCSSGIVANFAGTGPWSWTCSGYNGGTDSSCSASAKVVNGICGPANGIATANPNTLELCSQGLYSAVVYATYSTPWSWTCKGYGGGSDASCAAPALAIDGACGSASGTSPATAPTTNLCSTGTESTVTGGGNPWVWQCYGNVFGAAASCSTSVSKAQSDCIFNWAEDKYANYFAPRRPNGLTVGPYYARFYSNTTAYLGTSSADQHLYYLGPLTGGTIADLGLASTWLQTTSCR
jgi:hypothetical protein